MVNYFRKPVFLATLILVFIFYSGFFSIKEKNPLFCLTSKNQIVSVSGMLLSTPAKSSSGKTYSAKLQLSEIEDNRNVKSSAKGIITILIPSKMVEAYFPGKLYSSAKTGPHLYEAGGFYCFTGSYTNDFFLIRECKSCVWKSTVTGKIDYFRALCRLQFKRLMYSWNQGGGLLLALLSGAREYTDDDTKLAFKDAGLSHILALSGMHLSMFSAIAVFIGKKLKQKKLSYLLKSIVVIFFVWFAGFSPSLLRAFICSMLLLIASMISTEKPDMILILCFSFIIQVIISPSDISNVGFQLSYGALLGILLFSKFINQILLKILPNWLSSSLSASVSAQSFTVPISLKFFGSFSPIGIIATTIISPLITVFIYSGLILILISFLCPVLQSYSGIFINFLYTIIKKMVLFFSKAPRITI